MSHARVYTDLSVARFTLLLGPKLRVVDLESVLLEFRPSCTRAMEDESGSLKLKYSVKKCTSYDAKSAAGLTTDRIIVPVSKAEPARLRHTRELAARGRGKRRCAA